MISRFVRLQLLAFTTLSVVAIVVIAFVYAQVPTLLGLGQRDVYADFPDGSGLYEGSQVTYQGVTIGKVTSVSATGSGARATMRIDDSYRIPTNSKVEVHSVSAIGEQYVDFVPNGNAGPYLADGTVIPVGQTSIPPTIGSVLDDTNKLLASLPKDSLRITLDEAAKAFNGTGPALAGTINQAGQLVDQAQANLAPTQQLLKDVGPLLDTQTSNSAQIRSLVDSLSSFSDQLHASDGDIRTLLDRGTPMAQQIDGLFQQLRPTLPILLANMVNVEQVLVTYNPALEEVLVVFPRVTTALLSVTKPHQDDHTIGLDFRLVAQDPPPCTTGFMSFDQLRPPQDGSFRPAPTGLYCKLPQNSPSVVRGTRNMPCLNAPGRRAGSPEQCAGDGYAPEAQNEPPFAPNTFLGSVASAGYDPNSGTAQSPDGQLFTVGGIGTTAPKEADLTWQKLILGPIGR